MQSSRSMVSIHTAFAALLLGIGLTAARADTNADAFVAHQAATQTFEADLRQVFHWSFPRKPPQRRRRTDGHAPAQASRTDVPAALRGECHRLALAGRALDAYRPDLGQLTTVRRSRSAW